MSGICEFILEFQNKLTLLVSLYVNKHSYEWYM